VGVQEGGWDKEGAVRTGDCIFLYGKEQENHQLGIGMFVHHRVVSAVKRVEFFSDRMSYIYSSERSLVRCHCFECECTKCGEK